MHAFGKFFRHHEATKHLVSFHMPGKLTPSLSHPGFSYFKLDRAVIEHKTSTWTLNPQRIHDTSCLRVYSKVTRSIHFDYERARKRRKIYFDQPASHQDTPEHDKEAINHSSRNVPKVSVEDAEKVAEEMIESFSKNPLMRELLEGARFFAGSATLSGAVTTRRARTKIKLFDP
jgi:hypothetical protein